MTAQILRVINSQTIKRSILLDKIDESQGNTPGYAAKRKQKLYVPYVNPLDTTVAGYVDLIPTNNVLLQQGPKGVLTGLVTAGRVSSLNITSSQVKTPVISGVVHSGGDSTITGTTFLSVTPDVTYVTLINTSGVSQTFTAAALATQQLADLVALANQIKTKLNAHEANTGGVWHTNADATNTVSTANATDLPTAITLLNQIKIKYEAHRVLVGGSPVHANADTVNVVTAANATDLPTAIALSNDLKTKYNAHRTQATVHALNDTVNTVTAINGDSFSDTSITVADSIVTIGTPASGWKYQVQANSKKSNKFTL